MIKKIILLLAAAIAIGFFTSMFYKQSDNLASEQQVTQFTEIIQIDAGKDITLDFTGARVNVAGWDENYIRVEYWSRVSDEMQSIPPNEKKIKVSTSDNNLRITGDTHIPTVYNLQTWLPLLQFNKYKHQVSNTNVIGIGMSTMSTSSDYMVFVPKDIPVSINADKIKASNCKVNYINGKYHGK